MSVKITQTAIACCLVLLAVSGSAWGHPGGLDSSGCHHNRKTGDYHCHGGGGGGTAGQSGGAQSYNTPRDWGRGGASVAPTGTKNNHVQVVGVTDGDTIKVLIEGQQVKIRLYGIDAPESGQAFGAQAQNALKQITAGRKVTIKTIDTDRYGRTVALVYADGASVNEILVSSGYAWVYPQYCKQSFCSEWKGKETRARNSKNGLWLDDTPIAPWEWRHNK